SGDASVVADAAAHFDDTGRPKIGPGEFFFARPANFDRLTRLFCEPSGFERSLAGVLAAITGSGIGHNYAHAIFGNVECFRELGTDAERALRSGPDGELGTSPLRDGGARLERRVRDISNGV